ncbi:hypothetical protein PsorP6_014366 [Peronosclerospora sorghi]|uniref:Uncharacterized protein n=1 Tax=Peronosclerospora sorghi TaxID=230839 RepID=A0ACC0VJF4_9STRA|nr:hypothetical protein PsorP6_014366 [Peronosclerospora sorghi]
MRDVVNLPSNFLKADSKYAIMSTCRGKHGINPDERSLNELVDYSRTIKEGTAGANWQLNIAVR